MDSMSIAYPDPTLVQSVQLPEPTAVNADSTPIPDDPFATQDQVILSDHSLADAAAPDTQDSNSTMTAPTFTSTGNHATSSALPLDPVLADPIPEDRDPANHRTHLAEPALPADFVESLSPAQRAEALQALDRVSQATASLIGSNSPLWPSLFNKIPGLSPGQAHNLGGTLAWLGSLGTLDRGLMFPRDCVGFTETAANALIRHINPESGFNYYVGVTAPSFTPWNYRGAHNALIMVPKGMDPADRNNWLVIDGWRRQSANPAEMVYPGNAPYYGAMTPLINLNHYALTHRSLRLR